MKNLLTAVAVTACSLGLSTAAFAAKPAPPASAPEKVVGEAKPAAPEKAAPDAAKPIPMHSRADTIDAAAKTFTSKRKDGVEVKHVVTATTEIHQGDAPAKFEDIKAGDYVSGLRLKKSPTEYTVVKITKFGPKAEQPETTAKPEASKPAAAKPEAAKPAPKKAQ